MDRRTALEQIRAVCNTLATNVTSIHPLVSALEDKDAQDEIYKALFALTRDVEVVKKQLLKLERKNDSSEL